MVPPRGDAPRSAGYRPAALLLSYRGENWRSTRELPLLRLCQMRSATEMRRYRASRCPLDADVRRSGFRDRFLVYAGRAPIMNGARTRIAAPAAVQNLLRTSMVVRYRAQRSNLEPQPLEAAYANFVTPCGH